MTGKEGPACPCFDGWLDSPCSDFAAMTEMCDCANMGMAAEGAFVPG